MSKYLVGAGYHESPHVKFTMALWLNQIRKITQEKLVIISDSNHVFPVLNQPNVQNIIMDGNLGHAGDLLNGTKKHQFPGGPAVLMALAALAYVDEADLVYVEQDCLMFGDVISRLYAEIGDGGIIFGRSKVMPCENCLFLLKHEFIPEFLAFYAGSPAEDTTDQICEKKFWAWEKYWPSKIKYHTISGGRDRPLPLEDKEWFAQKLTTEELAMLKERGLI